MSQTGMSSSDLITGLTRDLLTAVDQLTPAGRLPTEQEVSRLIGSR